MLSSGEVLITILVVVEIKSNTTTFIVSPKPYDFRCGLQPGLDVIQICTAGLSTSEAKEG